MNKYIYKARNEIGELVEGELNSVSAEAASLELTKKKLTPVTVEAKGLIFDFASLSYFFYRIKTRDLSIFFKQIGTIFSAGVPLFETLTAVEEQVTDNNLKKVIGRIKDDIESGSSFSQALSKHPRVFSHLLVAMVEAGEKGGVLGDVLKRISNFLEKESSFQQKIKSALRYPILVLSVLGVGFIIAVTQIIPNFKGVFASFGSDLPLPTQILLQINTVFTVYWWLILIFAFLLYAAFKMFLGSYFGRRFWDRMMLTLPVIGTLNTKLSLARFFNMLSAMLDSGITIVYSLSVTADTADNRILSDAINDIQKEIIAGGSLSLAMKKHRLFPGTSVHMAAIGEKSGNLSEMLSKTAAYFDEEADYVVSNLMTLLEPFLIFIMALLVALLALGIFMPMWDLNSAVMGN
ncbi:hypothetical protein A2276_04725 [candidate division WOR-1 bacterium RIFOXYA12_FULL_43_27]|uniref:Type II secretion system protein GspF domain-containing protein n=1 Tax=candidate division WOR-1 bacterium RIFOXYC2_FULL_46_14 TaxID=1802587 RepID=A0A1F4U311_UNCSA|nr:MAG: hypothetical protein A2276_04725 [candidate division WOR-1 bacterium RIFOXYA12_FULL_43_27]OGC18871.1 MAG: hypothetical protein A2292_08110 [candidate division WOR-1 bacterium RIFOXYB2_FULL_46_45]OGC29012.1 MAG: hypothetical protein A2232_03175 [candidate division WOR-1 bacterium RIFOXYA2_FULL_46_56]OGC39271.1 MAG: hypothetical protein A2438_07075 [candidate division WOR-1 bacterium RIFOXYC2_FULL_46_14]